MIGDHIDRDDLVAYSLEALDPREAAAVEAHAPTCAQCSRELEALAPAVAVLAESVEQLEPPPELRERVLAVVREEAEAKRAELSGSRGREKETSRRERRSLRQWLLRPATGLAALAVVAAGLGGYLIAEDTGGGGAGGGKATVAVVPMSPSVGGTLAVGDVSSMLNLHGLRQLSGREVYQVWVAHGTSVRPSSNFIPDSSGDATTAVDGHLAKGTRVMVTREPHPGRTTPTPPVLLTATVQ